MSISQSSDRRDDGAAIYRDVRNGYLIRPKRRRICHRLPFPQSTPRGGTPAMTVSERHRVHSYPFSDPDRLVLDPMYAYLREHEPVARVRLPYGEPGWLVTRYADARTVYGDPRFSRAASVDRDQPRVAPRDTEGGILSMDPPEHTRLRRLVAKAFTARRVEQLRPRVVEIADGLIDAMVADGPPADLVERLALPLPVTVICELLGVPVADRHRFHVWSDAVVSTTKLPPEQIAAYH